MTTDTHFGYRHVPLEDKTKLVESVFRSVAPRYDLMNDLMSLGIHRLWKKFLLTQTQLRPHHAVLDVASGTGDVAQACAREMGKTGKIIATDINPAMLQVGQERAIDAGLLGRIQFIEANAEHLPFEDHEFDRITMAFGLRNVTDKSQALKELCRVLKPGGKCLILEFSHPTVPLLDKLYDAYSFHVIPALGEWVTKDRASYQYLVESIRMHPNQDTLKHMMEEAGFEDVQYFNLSGGIVALHEGRKY
jgi:demethylmenaquinone methyltransferase/2-methoxy-6-polyprenyl-1,4-benzoquinol methylase